MVGLHPQGFVTYVIQNSAITCLWGLHDSLQKVIEPSVYDQISKIFRPSCKAQ